MPVHPFSHLWALCCCHTVLHVRWGCWCIAAASPSLLFLSLEAHDSVLLNILLRTYGISLDAIFEQRHGDDCCSSCVYSFYFPCLQQQIVYSRLGDWTQITLQVTWYVGAVHLSSCREGLQWASADWQSRFAPSFQVTCSVFALKCACTA